MKLSKRTIAFLAIFATALALIVIGATLGQPAHVWQKAAMICFECIGLG